LGDGDWNSNVFLEMTVKTTAFGTDYLGDIIGVLSYRKLFKGGRQQREEKKL